MHSGMLAVFVGRIPRLEAFFGTHRFLRLQLTTKPPKASSSYATHSLHTRREVFCAIFNNKYNNNKLEEKVIIRNVGDTLFDSIMSFY